MLVTRKRSDTVKTSALTQALQHEGADGPRTLKFRATSTVIPQTPLYFIKEAIKSPQRCLRQGDATYMMMMNWLCEFNWNLAHVYIKMLCGLCVWFHAQVSVGSAYADLSGDPFCDRDPLNEQNTLTAWSMVDSLFFTNCTCKTVCKAAHHNSPANLPMNAL